MHPALLRDIIFIHRHRLICSPDRLVFQCWAAESSPCFLWCMCRLSAPQRASWV